MSAPSPERIRAAWRRFSRGFVLLDEAGHVMETDDEMPLPAMAPRMAAIVAAIQAGTAPEDMAGVVPGLTLGECRAALEIMERAAKREVEAANEDAMLLEALRPYFLTPEDTTSEAFARWSAAHPEEAP